MCGIAGRILKSPGKVGSDLVKLMDAQSHRGADSTGFAIYTEPVDGAKIRLMGIDRKHLDADLGDVIQILRSHGSDLLGEPEVDEAATAHYSVKMNVKFPRDVARWIEEADLIADRIEVQSFGKSLEIIKDVGDAIAVADKHGIREMQGTHGLGHARLATESNVSPKASHPFWARPFPDVAIVHNGQITNYYLWRSMLERMNYRFMTENDSELLAVWISNQMHHGLDLNQALSKSIVEIDGVFTFLISDTKGIGFAKDRFAMKPLVTIESEGELIAATEEQAVRCVAPHHSEIVNYDGPAITNIWPLETLETAA